MILTQRDGEELYVNPDHLTLAQPVREPVARSRIMVTGFLGSGLMVRETTSEIDRKAMRDYHDRTRNLQPV